MYLELELINYILSVVFHKDSSIDNSIKYTAPSTFTYGESVTISDIAVPANYHITSATGTVQGGGSWTITITDQNSLTFSGPAGNLTVDVYLSDEYTITITMPDGSYSDNYYFSFGEPYKSSGSWHIPIVQQSSGRDKVQIPVGSEQVIIDGINKYNGCDVVFSLYSSGSNIVEYHSGPYVLHKGSMDSDVNYDIYISVEWKVDLGANYTANYTAYNPDGSQSEAGELKDGDSVFTGYSIALTPNENYVFGPTFSASGATLTSDNPRTYRVIWNSGTVQFGDAILRQFTLTVTVVFSEPYPSAQPKGTFTLQDSTTTYTGDSSYQNGTLTIGYVLASGGYTWAADFDGFVESNGSTSVNNNMTIQVVLQPVEYVIEFYNSDGASIYTFSEYWDEIIGKEISSIYPGSSDAWGVYSSMWDDVVRVIESQDALGYDDFGGNDSDTKTLYLREIPGLLSDIVPGNLDIVIFTHQGGINGVHETDVKTGLESDIQYRVDVGGSTVLITVYADGRVLIDNCPEGTGMIVLDLGRGSSLMIVSLPNLDDTGASQ